MTWRDGPLYDAVLGATVTLILSFVPGSPVAGGAAASFRAESGYLAGVGYGTLAGVGAAIPLAALFVPAFSFTTRLGIGVDPASPAYGVFLALIAGMFLSYTVGLSAIGGLVGVAARRHTDWDLNPDRWL